MKQGLKLRYLPIIVWMCADKDILEQRITNRIDDMIYNKKGLIEAFEVFETFNKHNKELDFEKGIL